MTGAHPSDLLVLGVLWAGVCLVFALLGAIVDEGGLYDQWVALQARRRRRRLTRTFTTVAATAAFTLALPALATPRAEVGTAETSGRVSATSSDVLSHLVWADTSAPAPVDRALLTRAGAGIDPVAVGDGEAPTATEHTVWDRVAECESNGDWSINTGNGYYGGVQFSLRSWRWVGGEGYPHQATKDEQIARAERLLELQGWVAWPACSKRLGLR